MGVMAAISLAGAIWSIGYRDPGPAVVIPPTDTPFSLDLEVVATVDHEVVYAVEQRARPNYRIFAFDPATGTDETVFTVPEGAIVFGLALSPDGTTMAVSYTDDFEVDGGGIWLLDLTDGGFRPLTDVEPDIYLVDPSWSADGDTIYVTHVDRRSGDDVLSVARIDATSAAADPEIVAVQAIEPLEVDGVLHFLVVDDELARRSVGTVSAAGSAHIEISGGDEDLDHLVIDGGELTVAVLDLADEGLTFGEPASAHGSHTVPSVWWSVGADAAAGSAEALIVHDADGTDRGVVEATATGLAIRINGERTHLIDSRTIRFAAG